MANPVYHTWMYLWAMECHVRVLFRFSLPGDVTGQAVEIDSADWIMFDLVPCRLEKKMGGLLGSHSEDHPRTWIRG